MLRADNMQEDDPHGTRRQQLRDANLARLLAAQDEPLPNIEGARELVESQILGELRQEPFPRQASLGFTRAMSTLKSCGRLELQPMRILMDAYQKHVAAIEEEARSGYGEVIASAEAKFEAACETTQALGATFGRLCSEDKVRAQLF